ELFGFTGCIFLGGAGLPLHLLSMAPCLLLRRRFVASNPPLPRHTVKSQRECQQYQCCKSCNHGITPAPAPDPFNPSDRPGSYRLTVEPATEVIREPQCRRVPLRGILAQALQAHGLQVARGLGLQLPR